MINALSIDKIKILEFYGYTSVIPYNSRIADYNEMDNTGCKNLKKVFANVVSTAIEITGKSDSYFKDNKTVFKILHVETGTILYIGYKDAVYSIGLGYHQFYGKVYDFVNKTETRVIES